MIDMDTETSREIETPFGTYHARLTEPGHGVIESVTVIEVNRIPHKVDAYFRLVKQYKNKEAVVLSGYWHIQRLDQGLGFRGADPTDNARQKIHDSLQEPLLALIRDCAESRSDVRAKISAEMENISYKIGNNYDKIGRLQEENAELELQLWEAEKQREATLTA